MAKGQVSACALIATEPPRKFTEVSIHPAQMPAVKVVRSFSCATIDEKSLNHSQIANKKKHVRDVNNSICSLHKFGTRDSSAVG
jgi:hypothetical protein